MFRRRIAQNGIDLFRQEYPSEPEAFPTTGRPVFNPEQLQKMLPEARDPQERLALEGDDWLNNPRGELTMYRRHDAGEQYVIGADVVGVNGGTFLSPKFWTRRNVRLQLGVVEYIQTTLQRSEQLRTLL